MKSSVYGDNLSQLYPVVEKGMSDSGSLDNVAEFLIHAGGRSLPEVRKNYLFKFVSFSYRAMCSCGVSMAQTTNFWPDDLMNIFSPVSDSQISCLIGRRIEC